MPIGENLEMFPISTERCTTQRHKIVQIKGWALDRVHNWRQPLDRLQQDSPARLCRRATRRPCGTVSLRDDNRN